MPSLFRAWTWLSGRSLASKVVLTNLLVLGPAVGILVPYLWHTSRENTIAQSVGSAQKTIEQYKILRGYYTDNVVAKVQKGTMLQVSYDHHGREDMIPLPATFIHDLCQQYEQKHVGVRLKLYSDYPFPNRSNRVLDPFARVAIEFLRKNPDASYTQVEPVNGEETVRVAVADRMVSQSCVNCHKEHALSPKRDWKLGDVRGVLEVDVPIGAALAKNAATTRNAIAIVVGSAALIVVLTSILMRLVSQKLRRTVDVMTAVGEGDLTQRLEVASRDEVGQLAEGINTTIARIQSIVRGVRESIVQILSTASQTATATQQQEVTAQRLSSSTVEIAAAVSEISAAGKELVRTMDEVSEHASRVATMAVGGRSELAGIESTMKQLVESTASFSPKLAAIKDHADNITAIITTITKVADQTNLLSINAAIEAEKAGEYGRGFLVVAREIRRLADQSAVATLDIENMVRQMQGAVSAGVMQMDKFREEVRSGATHIAEINSQIGQVIEEVQGLTPRFRQVNDGMRDQSSGAQQIREAMAPLSEGAQQTAVSAEESKRATAHLRTAVELLNQEAAQFTT
jgi:methyl-accepting chemotaxis protein